MALSKTRILSVLVLVLAVLNVGLLTLLWRGRPGQRPPRPLNGPVSAYVVRELSLDAAQQQQYAALRQAHQSRMQALLPDLTRHRQALFAGLAGPPDEAARTRQLSQISALQRQADSLTYAHFDQVRQLLTPAQHSRWQQIAPTLPRMLQQQSRPGGPRGRMGRRGPGDGPPFGPPPGMGPPDGPPELPQ